jgi:hypothetical protein
LVHDAEGRLQGLNRFEVRRFGDYVRSIQKAWFHSIFVFDAIASGSSSVRIVGNGGTSSSCAESAGCNGRAQSRGGGYKRTGGDSVIRAQRQL